MLKMKVIGKDLWVIFNEIICKIIIDNDNIFFRVAHVQTELQEHFLNLSRSPEEESFEDRVKPDWISVGNRGVESVYTYLYVHFI